MQKYTVMYVAIPQKVKGQQCIHDTTVYGNISTLYGISQAHKLCAREWERGGGGESCECFTCESSYSARVFPGAPRAHHPFRKLMKANTENGRHILSKAGVFYWRIHPVGFCRSISMIIS